MKTIFKWLAWCYCSLICMNTHAQSWQWMKGGYNGESHGLYVATDVNENVYNAGINFGNTHFGPYLTPPGAGIGNLELVKYDSLGNVGWLIYLNSPLGSFPAGLTTDLFGNTYLIGVYRDSVCTLGSHTLINPDWPGSGSVHMGSACFFIAKINTSGSILWTKNVGNVDDEWGNLGSDITTDQCGNIFIACSFINNPAIGSYSFSNEGHTNFLVAKLDSSGSIEWAKDFPSRKWDWPTGIKVSALGNVFISGMFNSDTLQFGTTILTDTSTPLATGGAKNPSIFIAKLDGSGNPVWAKTNKGSAYCFMYGGNLAIDNAENAFITGAYYAAHSTSSAFSVFGSYTSPLISPVDGGGFVAKYDGLGNVVWVKNMSGAYGRSVAIDACQNVWLYGMFANDDGYATGITDTIDGYEIPVPMYRGRMSNSATFLTGWSNSGTYISTSTLPTGYGGGGGYVGGYLYNIGVDRTSNIYVTGVSEVDTFILAGDSLYNSFHSSAYNMFIAKYSPALGCHYEAPPVCHLDTIAGGRRICTGATTTLSDDVTGGRWSSSNQLIAVIDSITGTVSGIAAGIDTVTYTLGGTYVTTTITVSSLPPASVGGDSVVCLGSLITLSDALGGGVWASSNTTVATIGSLSGIANGIAIGTSIISYSFGAGCTVTRNITVNPLPAAMRGMAVCIGIPATIIDATHGGSWSSSTPAILTITSTGGFAAAIALGVDTITYTLPTGCSTRTTVTVNPSPTSITGTDHMCVGATSTLSDGVAGGLWTCDRMSIATTDSVTGIVSGISAGVAIISYSMGVGCFSTMTIDVNPLPVIYTLSAGGSYCYGGSGVNIELGGSESGVQYQLYKDALVHGSPLAGTGALLDLGLQTSAGIYTVIATNTFTGCVSSMTGIASINILSQDTIAHIYDTSVCYTSDAFSVFLTEPNGSAYTWYDHTTGASNLIHTGGTYWAAYKDTIACTYEIDTFHVAFNPVPQPISGPGNVCVGNTIELSDASVGGIWHADSIRIISMGATNGLFTGNAAGVATITYQLSTGCFTTITVSVLPTPCVNLVNEVTEGKAVSIFPNPTNETLTIKTPQGIYTNYTITNTVGQVLLQNELTNTQTTVNVKTLTSGLYYITLRGASGSIVQKFVKM